MRGILRGRLTIPALGPSLLFRRNQTPLSAGIYIQGILTAAVWRVQPHRAPRTRALLSRSRPPPRPMAPPRRAARSQVAASAALELSHTGRPSDHEAVQNGRPGRHNLSSPGRKRSVRLTEDQFIHCPVRAEMKLHPEALKLVDDKGSALAGTEFSAGWNGLSPPRS
jgi:hypothetical protein